MKRARIGNQRTMFGVPLPRDGIPIGVIGLGSFDCSRPD
jgi:hypothetical protein